MSAKYPALFAAYRLSPAWDPQAGSPLAGEPFAAVSRPVAPCLLSSYLTGAGVEQVDRLAMRRPIRWEYSADGGSTWLLSFANSGLRVDADGTIWIEGLRDAGHTFQAVETGSVPSLSVALQPCSLRATLAIPTDSRLTAALKRATDPTAGVAVAGAVDDADRYEPEFGRMLYVATPDAYSREEAYKSWPVPQVIAGAAEVNQTLRDDTDLIEAHASRRVNSEGRLRRGGILILPNAGPIIEPGTPIRALANVGAAGEVPVHAMAVRVVVQCGNPQALRLELG